MGMSEMAAVINYNSHRTESIGMEAFISLTDHYGCGVELESRMNREWVLVALVAMAAVLNVPIVHSQAPSFPPSAPCSSTSQCQSIYGLCWQCAGSCYPIAYQGPISNATYPRTAVCNDRVWGWLDNSTTRTACNYLTQPPNPIAACLNGQIVVGFEEKGTLRTLQ
eukprot:TRINITY_DN575_c0_g1_i2.p1 TRINITY_DN575_c0_g1~~TRINITY_DN575_c0_g1_i2.p1  ORF type:complete len:166 (-),score=9.12 TRINITY_DN575_c0_g1_i2:1166-1663(-)